jgi:hypothetical protein
LPKKWLTTTFLIIILIGAEFIKNLARPKNLNKKQSSFKRKENKKELVSIKHVKL